LPVEGATRAPLIAGKAKLLKLNKAGLERGYEYVRDCETGKG
jgi:hypothetical protein